jgi:hypothetical protein
MPSNVIQGNFGAPQASGTVGGSTGGSGGSGGGNGIGTLATLTRTRVHQIRHDKRLKTKDAQVRALFNYIWNQEIAIGNGSFIVSDDDRCFLLTGDTHQLYAIPSKNFEAHLWYRYGLLQTEQVTRHLIAAFEHYTRKCGRERQLRRFVFFCRETQTLYISRYNGTCWQIDGSGTAKIVPNGIGSALFIDDDGGKTPEDVIIGNHGLLLPTLVENLNYCPAENGMDKPSQKLALGIWLFVLAFPDLMPAKPMLLVEGERGSGKTSMIKLIQQAVHGAIKVHTIKRGDEDDFPVYVVRSPICLLDNTDTFVDWLQNTLASYTTGAPWTRRKLYTDLDQVEFRPQSFIAVTSRNPISFKRDDIADRCIIVRMGRRENFTPEAILTQVIDDKRSELYGEWIFFLDKIVAKIRNGALHAVPAAGYRMADFTALAYVIGVTIGATPEDVHTMLEGMETEREVLVAEGDPLLDMLDKWLEDTRNTGRSITSLDLFNALSKLAKEMSRNFYKSPHTLAQNLRREAIQKHFDVKHVGVQGNAKLYTIRRKEG